MKANSTVGSAFGNPEEIRSYKEDNFWVLPKTMIGIELELEGVTSIPVLKSPNYWSVKEDGSLRNLSANTTSIELVLNFPLSGHDLTSAISYLNTVLNSKKEKYKISPRCSTHIHLDVRELDFNKLLNLLIIYTILEKPLYNYCGGDRENNNFCLPFYKAEKNVFEHLSYFDIVNEHFNKLQNIVLSDYRYSGLNLCSIKKFGSLEFRQFPGTMDVHKISQWINIIMCIKKAAIEYNKELKVLPLSFSENGIEKSVSDIFGKYFKYIKYSQLEYDVLCGVRQAQDIIYKRNIEIEDTILSAIDAGKTSGSYYDKLVEKFDTFSNDNPPVKQTKFIGHFPYLLNILKGDIWPFNNKYFVYEKKRTTSGFIISIVSNNNNITYSYSLLTNGYLFSLGKDTPPPQ